MELARVIILAGPAGSLSCVISRYVCMCVFVRSAWPSASSSSSSPAPPSCMRGPLRLASALSSSRLAADKMIAPAPPRPLPARVQQQVSWLGQLGGGPRLSRLCPDRKLEVLPARRAKAGQPASQRRRRASAFLRCIANGRRRQAMNNDYIITNAITRHDSRRGSSGQ
jgi:hypothetical protein